eukprot:scaffold350473_cov59-Attheya_sp.AAC.1
MHYPLKDRQHFISPSSRLPFVLGYVRTVKQSALDCNFIAKTWQESSILEARVKTGRTDQKDERCKDCSRHGVAFCVDDS